MSNANNADSTLQDIVNSIATFKQSVNKRFDGLETRFDGLAQEVEHLKDRLEDVAADVKVTREDVETFAGDTARHTLIEIPHAKLRLDRLEEHAQLQKIPVLVPEI